MFRYVQKLLLKHSTVAYELISILVFNNILWISDANIVEDKIIHIASYCVPIQICTRLMLNFYE